MLARQACMCLANTDCIRVCDCVNTEFAYTRTSSAVMSVPTVLTVAHTMVSRCQLFVNLLLTAANRFLIGYIAVEIVSYAVGHACTLSYSHTLW
jgi:hypothetical protein